MIIKESVEDIFIIFESLDRNDMYDITIVDGLLEKLKYIFIHSTKDKINELYKWINVFTLIGYDENCYIFEWINELYQSYT